MNLFVIFPKSHLSIENRSYALGSSTKVLYLPHASRNRRDDIEKRTLWCCLAAVEY